MKINRIKRICKMNKSLILSTDEDGNQWIGNGAALYRVEGMPELTAGNVLSMFELNEEDVEDKWFIQEETMPSLYDTSLGEHGDHVEETLITYEYEGDMITAMRIESGELIVSKDIYMSPVADETTEVIVRYTEPSHLPYLIVRRGFMNIAIINPLRIRASAETFNEKLQFFSKIFNVMVRQAVAEEGTQKSMEA